MSLHEVMIEGTLQPDGTLQLDSKPSLLPGRITVVLRQESEPVLPQDDPFWQRMQAIWAIPISGAASDGSRQTGHETEHPRGRAGPPARGRHRRSQCA